MSWKENAKFKAGGAGGDGNPGQDLLRFRVELVQQARSLLSYHNEGKECDVEICFKKLLTF